MSKTKISALDFAVAREKCNTMKELAELLGKNINYVSTRTTMLKKRGVKLKSYQENFRGTKPIDVDAINQKLKQLRGRA
jgi:predicted transcriptional regulator